MIFNLTQKYKHIIFSLLILLMSSCNSGPSISSAQKNFTETWRNFLNKYLDSDTSVRENYWLDQTNNHLNQKISVKDWYGTIIEVGDSFSGKYITAQYDGIKYYLYPKGSEIDYLQFEPGMELLFSGVLNKMYIWDSIKKPGLYVYNTQIKSVDNNKIYFLITENEMEGLFDLLKQEASSDAEINKAWDELNDIFNESIDEIEKEIDNLLDDLENELDINY